MARLIKPTQKALDAVDRPEKGKAAIEIRIENYSGIRIWRGPHLDTYGGRITVNRKRQCFKTCRGVTSIRQGLSLAVEDMQQRRLGKISIRIETTTEAAADLYVSPHIEELKDAKGAFSRQKVLHNLVLADGQRVGDIPSTRHDKETALAVLAAAKPGRKPATVRRLFSRYSKNLSIFVDEGLLGVNPCQGIKLPRENNIRTRILTDEEMQLHAVKALAMQSPQGHCQLLAAVIGCRIGEAISLKWSSVQPDGMSVIIDDTKNGSPSTYPLNSLSRSLLQQCRKWRINEYVFPSTVRNEGHITQPRKAFEKIRAEVMAEVGTEGLLPEYWQHDFRRSFGSKCNAVMGDLRATQQLLNHKSSTTTERYTHHVPAQLIDASERTVQALFGGALQLIHND